MARREIKVLLSGQGADELLAGYISYYQAVAAAAIRAGRVGQAVHCLRLQHSRFGQGHPSTLRWLARTWMPRKLSGRLARGHMKRAAPWLDVDALNAAGMDAWAEMRPDRASPKTLRDMLLSSMQDSLVALLRYDDRNSMAIRSRAGCPS